MAQLLIHLIRLYPRAQCGRDFGNSNSSNFSSRNSVSTKFYSIPPYTWDPNKVVRSESCLNFATNVYLVQMCFGLKYLSTLWFELPGKKIQFHIKFILQSRKLKLTWEALLLVYRNILKEILGSNSTTARMGPRITMFNK